MKKLMNKLFYLSFLMISFLACKTETKTGIENLEQLKTEKINSLGNRYLELNRFSGVILVTKGDSILYSNNFGLADYENNKPFSNKTSFRVGKISELIIVNIIREMVIEDKFQLSDNISKYIPETKSELTINDLLNHKPNSVIESSGKSEESDLDYNSLGLLIENISGKSFQENIEEYSNNLELENTYFQKASSDLAIGYLYHNYQGNGLELQKSPVSNSENTFSNGLKSTANDLAKIISSNSENKLEIEGYIEDDGFSYSAVNNPQNKTSIIVLSNRRHPVAKEISNSIGSILEDKEYRLPLSRIPFDIDKTILKDFIGNYSLNENVNFEVLHSNDSLFVLMGPNKTYLVPQSTNQFYMQQMDASMRFLRDSTEVVNRVALLNGFIESEQTANRIK
ncbi:serine hydrolase domain-containing protein [uncultured Winogradskyella sp.]|uniref:serine hydrolase domain-containing protein n=1 Tax=uncultured Winogradskyella sp. TaxID=395353 RepID=UPI0026357476|nr:serine hydrolase domain-containing protein [uncultured Winogradskyella sp.]